MPEKFPSKPPGYDALVKLLNLGSVIFGLALVGIWLDQKFHTLPLCTAIGIALGVLFSFYEAWRVYKKR